MRVLCRTAAIICVIYANSLSADNYTFTSTDGARRITVNDANQVFYQSGNGSLSIEMSESGMKIGAFEIRVKHIASYRGGRRFYVTVKNGKTTKQAEVEITSDNSMIEASNIDDLNTTLLAFHRSAEGHLLQEARALIDENLASSARAVNTHALAIEKGEHGIANAGEQREAEGDEKEAMVQPMFSGWSCTRDILNGVAAGAAMVAGCGTPSCGPAWGWCCGGGIAWYGSALIGIGQSCNFVY